MSPRTPALFGSALFAAASLPASAPTAFAQGVGLNYERLSSLEEPLAVDIGGWTATATGVLDAPLTVDLTERRDSQSAFDAGLIANATVAFERQLKNRWTVRAGYFGQVESNARPFDGVRFGPATSRYTDRVAVSVRNYQGEIFAGNVSGAVRDFTRRVPGAGNAALQYDTSLAGLEEWSIGYLGRFGPTLIGGVVDQEGGFDLGASYQRPLLDKDYRFTARLRNGDHLSADETTRFETLGLGFVAELTYGSLIVDAGLGYDHLAATVFDADRVYASAGARYKWGAWTASGEGRFGWIDGKAESAAAAGLSLDLARGLSANLGLNYVDSRITRRGVRITDDAATSATSSLRYSF